MGAHFPLPDSGNPELNGCTTSAWRSLPLLGHWLHCWAAPQAVSPSIQSKIYPPVTYASESELCPLGQQTTRFCLLLHDILSWAIKPLPRVTIPRFLPSFLTGLVFNMPDHLCWPSGLSTFFLQSSVRNSVRNKVELLLLPIIMLQCCGHVDTAESRHTWKILFWRSCI